ncbi:hypothetical protein JCM19231_2106 [Vibrio ishigakensis]|uniref:Uncharacterized protein n=1 Tax=Vibrio ishigakensis TaxID=1481914 RepID=A0A0B8P3X3_9VIBR|nr:hypothetical protein JCM19231_2106 [Vibrio ishigakensis]
MMGDGELQLSITEESKIAKANLGLEAHHNKREEQLTRLMAIKNLLCSARYQW